jgi:hypothetical protein
MKSLTQRPQAAAVLKPPSQPILLLVILQKALKPSKNALPVTASTQVVPMGKKHGAVGGFAYSAGLLAKPGNWDFEGMDAWLKSPKKYVEGTKMSFAGLSKPEDRADVIAYLNAQGSNLPVPAAPAEGAPAAAAPAAAGAAPAPAAGETPATDVPAAPAKG